MTTFEPHRITLACHKCLRVKQITGKNEKDCLVKAKVAKWAYDELGFVCHKCPAIRAKAAA